MRKFLFILLLWTGCSTWNPPAHSPETGGWDQRFIEWNTGPDGERVPGLDDTGIFMRQGL